MLISALTVYLQAIASWLLSVLALMALLVSVIICIAFMGFLFKRGSFAQAYTVKTNLSYDIAPHRPETFQTQ